MYNSDKIPDTQYPMWHIILLPRIRPDLRSNSEHCVWRQWTGNYLYPVHVYYVYVTVLLHGAVCRAPGGTVSQESAGFGPECGEGHGSGLLHPIGSRAEIVIAAHILVISVVQR